MSNVVSITKGADTWVFDDVFGHQAGQGMVQVMHENGNSTIINGFDEMTIVLDAEQQEAFKAKLAFHEEAAKQAQETSEQQDQLEEALPEGKAN